MSLAWDGVPAFATGQYLSATGQVNALSKAAGLLFDRVTGFSAPFCGASGPALWAGRWDGQGLLDWRYELKDGTAYIKVNGVEAAGTRNTVAVNAFSTFTGTLDLEALMLGGGSFYTVEVVTTAEGLNCALLVWLLRARYNYSGMYPALATFADGTTPSAAQWNALAATAAILHGETTHPRAPFACLADEPGDDLWRGTFTHRANTLAYQLRLVTTYNPAGDGTYSVTAGIYIESDTLPKTYLAGATNTQGPTVLQTVNGAVDLTPYGIPVGSDYRILVETARSGGADAFGGVGVDYLYETADADPAVPGWVNPPTWAHPAYLAGVNVLRDDLAALKTYLPHGDYPCRLRRNPAGFNGYPLKWQFEHRRVHRWLHYLCANKKAEAKLRYYTGAVAEWNEHTVTLSAATAVEAATLDDDDPVSWKAFDLGAQEGLWPGTRYWITGVEYCMEAASA